MAPVVSVYYQTQYDWGHNATYVSPLPLLGLVSHLYLAAYHINTGKPLGQSITLNDNPPETAPYYTRMWDEITQLQQSGIKIVGMLGGAAPGTFTALTPANWDRYYPDLKKTIADYKLDGIDIDVEQSTDISIIIRLITQLKGDFGPDFIISLAPVASAMTEGANLSGFNYRALEQQVGANITLYSAQFYSGFGSFFPDDQYIRIVEHANGIFPPHKVVASILGNPSLGSGYTAPANVVQSIKDLISVYGSEFGGVNAWEYFALNPEPYTAPYKWPQLMKETIDAALQTQTRETPEAARERILERAAERARKALAEGIDILGDVELTGPLRKESKQPWFSVVD